MRAGRERQWATRHWAGRELGANVPACNPQAAPPQWVGITHPQLLQGGDKWLPSLGCRRQQKALVISISAAYRAASGRLRSSQEGAVRLTAGTASSEGLRGTGGASSRFTHETVGKRPQFSSKTANDNTAAGLPHLLRETGAQPSEAQPHCLL